MIENFDPNSATAEDIAFGAMTALESPTPEIEPMRPVLLETVRSYAENRKARGLPLFPNRTAQANAARNAYLRDIFTKPLDQVLPADAAQKLAAREALHPDPEGYRAREVTRSFLTALTGKPLNGASYDMTRDLYAKQHLGLTGDTSDKAVFNAIRARHQEDEREAGYFTAKLTEGISARLSTVGKLDTTGRTATNAEISGYDRPAPKSLEKIFTIEDREKFLSGISERNRPAYRAKWNEANRELTRQFRKHQPLVEEVTSAVAQIRSADDPEEALMQDIVNLAAKLPDAKADREIAMAMIGNAVSNFPEDVRGTWARIAAGAMRGVNRQLVMGNAKTGQAIGRQALGAFTGMESVRSLDGSGDMVEKKVGGATGFLADESRERLQRAAELFDVIAGNGMNLKKVSDNLFQASFVAAAQSAWMLPAAFVPVGQAAIVSSMAGASMLDAETANPNVDEGLQTNAGLASGMVQGAIESFTNVAGVKLMMGKLPRFAGLLNKAGVTSPAGRAALGAAAGYTAVTGMEYTEEALQGATDLAFQALAQDLAGQKPDVDWSGYFKDWLTVAGPEQKETLLAVSAFGMVAGAGASYNHFRYGSALARSKTFLRANGFTEAEVRDITNTTDLDEAAEKTRAAFDQAQARIATATDEDKLKLADLRQQAIEVLRASNEAYAAAGMPRIVQERNEFTEEDQWVFIDTTSGSRKAFETEEEALGAWQDWNSEQSEENIAAIREAGEAAFLETLQAEGAIAEDVNVERINRTVTPATERADAQAEVTAAETDARKAITPQQERAARTRLEGARERMNTIGKRVEIFLMERGIDPTNATAAAKALDSVVIKAKSFATLLQGRVVGYTVQLYNGAEIQDIAEDFSETSMKIAMEEGWADPEIILDDIRRYEAASGNRVIEAGYEYDPGNRLPLIEGFSKLARGVLMGEVRTGMLPPEVSAWIEMQASLMAVSVDIAKAGAAGSQFATDVATAAEWRKAVQSGQVPARLERLLKDSLGLDTEAQNRRLEKRMEEQLAAEAMDGFPEISDVAKGRLPHPETLRENNHPLYGEVRRIWEAMKKPTKRRTKQGRAIDRTNEANAYFLPVGEMEDLDNVRQAVNERGFAFDTITDMLDALDVSISYGKPFYGTASVGDESFSLGRSTVTPSAETRTFQGTNGETVIGPASYAISAFHGTPHKVDRFTIEKIGTGEGAQAYGWGLYFADQEKVAAEYKKILGSEFRLDGKVILRGGNFGPGHRRLYDELGEEAADIVVGFIDQGKDRVIDELNNPLNQIDQDTFEKAADLVDRIESSNTGNLYRVTLKVEDEELLDWDKPLAEQPAKVQEWMTRFLDMEYDFDLQDAEDLKIRDSIYEKATAGGVYRQYALEAGEMQEVTERLQKLGIRGIRYLDGNSRSAGQGSYNYVIFDEADIEILEENGQPVTMAETSFAMSTPGLLRLEAAIAKRMTRGPDERAEFFQRLRDRLAATVLQAREAKRNLATDQTDVERERARIRDAVAEAAAILKALPADARGRVPFSINDVLDADTERGQINALIRLIDKADDALEVVLLKEYREAFETLLDLAKPDLKENKQVRGRLTPETQRMVNKILAVVTLTPAELAIALPAKAAEIEALEATNPTTPEEIAAAQKQLVELYTEQGLLETFGAFSTLDAARTAHAYEQLQSIYVTGRTQRRILDEARKEEMKQAKAEILSNLREVDQGTHAERTNTKGIQAILDQAEAFRLGMSSFHQVMEWIFPRSTVARDFAAKVRSADRAFVRAKLQAKDRFDRYTFGVWNLSGPSRHRKRNRILADLSTLRTDWNIDLQEGVTFATEKLTEQQAAAIIDGTMKVGWETDNIAMTSLRQALADFRMQRLKAQNEQRRFTATTIKFQRLTHRGRPGPFVASDLQALYFVQLYAQEQYRPALDKFGWTAEVMEKITARMNPKAKDIGDFLRDEYDAEWSRLNPVYRRIYGLDMPRIRNYAPGLFEHLDGKGNDNSTIDPYGTTSAVNAMSAGFTKARTHHMARPSLTNAMQGYWSHLEATEYFIAYAEIMRDARQIFRNPEVRRRIEGNFGTDVAGVWSQWLDALELDGNFRAVEMKALAKMTQRTLATQSAVGLAFNVGVLFKQTTAAMGVMLEMPTTAAVKGFARAMAKPSTLRTVWKSEAIQQRVMAGMSPEDRRMLDAARANPSIIMELLEIGRLPIAYADAAFTTISGSIAYAYHYEQAVKSGMSTTNAEAAALAVASRVIERTAQPATAQDKSMAELTAKGFSKFLFLFKSDPRQKLATFAAAWADVYRGEKGALPVAIRKTFWGWCVYGLMAEVMTDVWAGISRDDDDEERWSWKDYAAAALVGPIAGIPLIGSMMEYLVRSTVGTKAFISSGNPVEQGAAKLFGATMKTINLATEDTKEADVTDILTASQQATAAMAQIAGAFDPRAAIIPAGLRLTRDAFGTLTNMADLLTEPTADDQALEIIREISATEKTTREGKAEANTALAKELAKLPAADRAQRLQRLDADQRAAVKRKLRASAMTSSEMALDKLGKEARTQAIDKITATMNESEARDYRARLLSLGLVE